MIYLLNMVIFNGYVSYVGLPEVDVNMFLYHWAMFVSGGSVLKNLIGSPTFGTRRYPLSHTGVQSSMFFSGSSNRNFCQPKKAARRDEEVASSAYDHLSSVGT